MAETILRESIVIHAPIERCFALSTSVDLVAITLGFTAIEGVTTGRVEADSRVVWRGRMFGLNHFHHTLNTAFDPLHFFQDTQKRGRFAAFHHDHYFTKTPEGTLLQDEVHLRLPFGPIGALVARWIVAPRTQQLMRSRFALLKQLAEGDGWHVYV